MLIDPASTALIVIDLQEKLVPVMNNFEACANRIELLLDGARELHLNTLVTEQYPTGLGGTLSRFVRRLPEHTPILPKTSFSVFADSGFRTALSSGTHDNLIFCGIESNVCVLQSVFNALERGFKVFLAADAVTGRRAVDQELALQAARSAGAMVLSVETLLFMLLGDSKHPAFKAVSKLLR